MAVETVPLPADAELTNGVGTFSATFKTSGYRTISATDTVTSSINGYDVVNVAPLSAHHFGFVIGPDTRQDKQFSVWVYALDQFDNVFNSYNGTASLTSNIVEGEMPASVQLINGVGQIQVTIHTLGEYTISAQAGSLSGTSETIYVTRPVIFELEIDDETLIDSLLLTLTATNQEGIQLTDWNGCVTFTIYHVYNEGEYEEGSETATIAEAPEGEEFLFQATFEVSGGTGQYVINLHGDTGDFIIRAEDLWDPWTWGVSIVFSENPPV